MTYKSYKQHLNQTGGCDFVLNKHDPISLAFVDVLNMIH